MEFDWTSLEKLEEVNSAYAAGFSVARDVCMAAFDADMQIVNAARPLLVDAVESRRQDEWGTAMADTFVAWREDIPPTLPCFLALACDAFDIDADHPLVPAALAACVLGETPHLNSYHNTAHFREVMAMAIRLCATHRQVNADSRLDLSADDIVLLILAAAIHDFGHDGQGNFVDGHHYPSRLELRAVDYAMPFLIAAGMTVDQGERLTAMVLATDVSHSPTHESPSAVLRAIYHAHMRNLPMPDCDMLLSPLVEDYKTALMALLLGEADIAPSAGLSYDFSVQTTVMVAAESTVLQPSAATLHGFMDHICHGQYLSPAARHLMAENFTAISLRAAHDSENDALYA